jgi:hypothetical protein
MTMRMMAAVQMAAFAAGLALGGTASLAQTSTGTIAEPTALSLVEEDEAALRDYVRRRPVERIVAIRGGLAPGRIVPREVRLSPLANISVEGLGRYAYVVSPDEKIVIVDPASRRVISVVDR